MRTFLILLAAATASLTASAYAGSGSLSIRASGTKVLYGHQLTLSGRLSSDLANRPVSIYGKPLGAGPTRIATVRTRADGSWSVRIRPAIATTYQARLGSTASRAVTVGVAPAITTRALADGVWAHVAGGTTFRGRKLQLQRWNGAGWTTIVRKKLNGSSDATFTTPVAHGHAMLRVALSVNQAGAGYLGAASHPFAFRAASVSASSSAAAVSFGHSLVLRGRISSGRAGQKVIILARRYGTPAAVRLTSVLTGAGGRWASRIRPTIQTSYRAGWAGAQSRELVVGVRPALSDRRLANGRLEVTLAPAGAFVGRTVQLQRLTAGGWRTIDRVRLAGPRGHGLFPAPVQGGAAKLRVAMSVNEAGAGYLGVLGRSLAYRVPGVSIAPSTFKTLYGHSVTLAGNISSGRGGQHITILAWPYGRSAPGKIATVVTGAGGRWTLTTRPSVMTTYRASWRRASSRAIAIGVEPRVTVELLGNGRIAVHVATLRPLAGRVVQLQQSTTATSWGTIERVRLNRRAAAVFRVPAAAAASTMRVAISVNEAGAGLLGARSHPFVHHGV